MASIQGIYIALFGRPADPLGLDYFNSITNGGRNLSQINSLAGQPEYLTRFEGMNNVQIVTSIYQELFGRNPDAAGLAFFTTQLNSGAQNINTIAINILDGARGEDAALVAAKIAAADQFTAAIRADPDALAAYQGQQGIAFGQAFLDQIDSSDDRLTSAQVTEQVNTFVDTGAVPGTDPDAPTNQINFTDAVGEQLVGTAQNDAFNGVVGTNGTVNVGDSVSGAAGTDTLNLLVVNGATALPAGFSSSSVEVVNVTYAENGTLGTLNSASFGGVQQIWQIDNVAGDTFADITIGDGVTAGFRSTGDGATAVAAAATVTVAAGVTSAAVALDGIDDGSNITLAETTANGLSTVSVSGSVATTAAVADDPATPANEATPASSVLTLTGTAADIDTLNLSLSSNTTVAIGSLNDLNTLNASGSTGNLTVNLGTPDELTSATFGTGSDTVTLNTGSLAAGTLAVNLGAGNDTIVLTAGNNVADTAVTITLGAGSDSVDINGLTNITATTAVAADLITVADFNAATDVLDLAGLGPRDVLINNELSNISQAATLDAALTLAAQYTDAGSYSVFNYGGDAYVFNNAGTAAFGAGDGLVHVVGLTVEQITDSNFVA